MEVLVRHLAFLEDLSWIVWGMYIILQGQVWYLVLVQEFQQGNLKQILQAGDQINLYVQLAGLVDRGVLVLVHFLVQLP